MSMALIAGRDRDELVITPRCIRSRDKPAAGADLAWLTPNH